jgi:hypothetical protein
VTEMADYILLISTPPPVHISKTVPCYIEVSVSLSLSGISLFHCSRFIKAIQSESQLETVAMLSVC